jgi:hypothetical protein
MQARWPGAERMKILSIFVTTLVFALQTQLAHANCTDLGQEAKESYARLLAAKEAYKHEFYGTANKPLAAESLSEAIASNRKMKAAMDDAITALVRSKDGGCFGSDTAKWTTVIAVFQAQSADMDKTRDEFLRMRSEMAKKSK